MEIVETRSQITADGMSARQSKQHLFTIGLSPQEFGILAQCIVCGANLLNLDNHESAILAGMHQTVEQHLKN